MKAGAWLPQPSIATTQFSSRDHLIFRIAALPLRLWSDISFPTSPRKPRPNKAKLAETTLGDAIEPAGGSIRADYTGLFSPHVTIRCSMWPEKSP